MTHSDLEIGRATVAALTGLAAKETVVATFGILYHNSSEAGLAAALRGDYSSLAAYSFLIFNLLCAPCFAAIGAIKREMASLNGRLVLSVSKQVWLIV